MSRPAGAAWSLAAVTCVVTLSRLVVAIVAAPSPSQVSSSDVPEGGVPVAVFEAVVLMTVAVIGAVVAGRQPRNGVGWILCVIPLSLSVLILSSHVYWALVLHDVGSERTVAIVAWLASWTWVPALIPMVTFFLLLYPTGRPPSPRWRPVTWMAAATVVLILFTEVCRPGRLQEYPVDNPFGLRAAGGLTLLVSDVLWLATTLLALTSLVVRFRRSHGDERQQVKWVVMAAVMFVVNFILAGLAEGILGEDASFAMLMLGFLFIATGIGVAMLRYRLYDIDVVINRALVYGSLTATLAGVYVGSVLLLQVALSDLTQGSGLAVAASTLAVAALFGPARARIQRIVDRRFFRSRYDVRRTVEAFGARLRDEVDLAELTVDLQAVVMETMRPAHVSLWLRTAGGSR